MCPGLDRHIRRLFFFTFPLQSRELKEKYALGGNIPETHRVTWIDCSPHLAGTHQYLTHTKTRTDSGHHREITIIKIFVWEFNPSVYINVL